MISPTNLPGAEDDHRDVQRDRFVRLVVEPDGEAGRMSSDSIADPKIPDHLHRRRELRLAPLAQRLQPPWFPTPMSDPVYVIDTAGVQYRVLDARMRCTSNALTP